MIIEEPRYTAAEWKKIQANRHCATFGHEWVVIQSMQGPTRLYCSNGCDAPVYDAVERKKED